EIGTSRPQGCRPRSKAPGSKYGHNAATSCCGVGLGRAFPLRIAAGRQSPASTPTDKPHTVRRLALAPRRRFAPALRSISSAAPAGADQMRDTSDPRVALRLHLWQLSGDPAGSIKTGARIGGRRVAEELLTHGRPRIVVRACGGYRRKPARSAVPAGLQLSGIRAPTNELVGYFRGRPLRDSATCASDSLRRQRGG